jgi:hypothetical protein
MTRVRWGEGEIPAHFPSRGKASNAPSLAMTVAASGAGGLGHLGQRSAAGRVALRPWKAKMPGPGSVAAASIACPVAAAGPAMMRPIDEPHLNYPLEPAERRGQPDAPRLACLRRHHGWTPARRDADEAHGN